MLRALFAAIVLPLAVIPLTTVAMLLGFFGARRTQVDVLYRAFCRVALWATGAELLPTRWHIPPQHLPAQAVLVSNHESLLDPPAMCVSLTPRSVRFVAKASLFRIPFFGWALAATGNVPVSRNRTSSDLTRLRDAGALTKLGDVLFFAEGSRGRDGSYRELKKGAFAFAIEHQMPILPVAVGGSFECLPPHVFAAHRGKIAVVVGEPIDSCGCTLDDRHALRDRVQIAVASLRQEALQLSGSPRGRN